MSGRRDGSASMGPSAPEPRMGASRQSSITQPVGGTDRASGLMAEEQRYLQRGIWRRAKAAQRARRRVVHLEDPGPGGMGTLGDTLAAPDPYAMVIDHVVLDGALRQLDATTRLVVTQHDGNGVSYRQLAAQLHCSESWVRVLRNRGLRRLRTVLVDAPFVGHPL